MAYHNPLIGLAYDHPIRLVLFSIIAAILVVYYKLVLGVKRAKLPVYTNHHGWFASWKDSLDYVRDSPGVLRAGYEQFSKHGQFYQLRTPARWVIVVPPQYIDEIRTAPSYQLSAQDSADDVQQQRHTISPIVQENKFHLHTVRTHLTPSLDSTIDDLVEEIQLALQDEIGTPTEWKSVTAARIAPRIATRTANRTFVGPTLCRNEEYLQLSLTYAVEVFGGADKLRSWPEVLKPIVAKLMTNIGKRQQVARRHLLPYIKERIASGGVGKIQAADALQWCLDAAPSIEERDPERLVYRLLHLNVASVHTTSVTFLNCLYDLVVRPEIHAELREEITSILQEDGWSTKGLNRMWKLDSFMLESQRLSPMASSQMTRAVVSDFTFSNGTTVPKGTYVLAPMHAMYLDDELYPDASTFDAFRWSRLREQPGNANRFRFVSTNPRHINFGHGKDACPGRFFAAQEIKLLLAHILLRYEVKLAGSTRPSPTWYDRSCRPNQTAQVLFRARAGECLGA
ncbi:Cytochrome-P450 monooxygenase [Teratosphaeria destructans]|uniref:Cytochrome-P450 monooxygenase n=1 Tax=Teratosphaeria destructans TaxID=418781 RepID=A0A9W7W0G4_9PEZI|nr:Cytochrome-P450 monooxygenase [Teratosphaeria destructans]